MKGILTLAALAAVLAVTTARAQSQSPSQSRSPSQSQSQSTNRDGAVNDWLFAEAAAAGGLAEVALSEIGVQRATDPDLKKFSQEMVDEHSRLNQELAGLAAQRRVALPRTLDVCTQFCTQNLKGMSREHFDKCYAKAQLAAHMEALAAFEAEAERGQDPTAKSFASKALPRIKEHLKTIKPIVMKFEKERENESEKAEK
jgi:putative membrane protein